MYDNEIIICSESLKVFHPYREMLFAGHHHTMRHFSLPDKLVAIGDATHSKPA
jgi:hypothetical protein